MKRWGIGCSWILVAALSFDASAKSKTASKAKQKSAKKEKRNTRRPAGQVSAATRPSVPFKGKGRVTASVLNLRAAPDAAARDIGDVARGTKLHLIARTKERFKEDESGASYWYQTKHGGRTGWLWGGYLHVTVTKPPRPPSETNGRATQWIEGRAYSMLNGLNLREGPTTRSRDLGDIPFGQKLAIHARTIRRYREDDRGRYRWYEVSFKGKRGWAFGAYLRFHSPPPSADGGGGAGYAGYSASRGQSLANASYRRGTSRPTVGYCLKGVEEAMRASITPGYYTGQPGAHQFGEYARAHHARMAGLGLRVDGTPPGKSSTFPKGTIMIFRRGRCGFNPSWGHIEVVVDHDTACSDHCRRRNDEVCGPTTILYPTKR